MATITFDTHKLIRKLRDAEGISDAIQDLDVGHDLAARRDAEAVRQEIRELELRMDTKLETVRDDMKAMKWMLGVIVAGVIALVMKSFFHA